MQWQIQGVARDAHPSQSIFFIFMQCLTKIMPQIGQRPRGCHPPLDPTLDLLVIRNIHKHIFSLILFQISNIPFIVLPATLMVLSREYCARISRDMYMVCALLMVIGVSSAYFHATLSMLGQLLDELAILWLDLGATALWLPMEYFPAFCGHSR